MTFENYFVMNVYVEVQITGAPLWFLQRGLFNHLAIYMLSTYEKFKPTKLD